MYENLIIKNIQHFGPEGIIMYSKSCDYYNINQVSLEDIKMFYDLLISNEPLPNSFNKLPYISCCLYFLSKNNEQYEKIFTTKIIQKLSRKDEVNDTNMFLIFNIIEFDQRYLHSRGERLKFLLEYLEKFSPHKKTIDNFLLYKYYRGILKYHLGSIDEAYGEYLEIIIGSEEYAPNKTKYIEFIRLKNDLFKVQLDLSKHNREEYFEQYCFMKELFDKIKVQNKKLGVKLGFCLYTILLRQNKFNECIPLLIEMKKILKNETLSGVKLKMSIDYYLAIFSRIGYIGVLIGDKKSIEYVIKKFNSILSIIEKDKQEKKLTSIYNTYSFIVSILNIYLGNYEDRLKEKATIFTTEFFTNKFELKNNYLVNKKNRDDLIIDLYAVNNMDYNLSVIAKKIMDNYQNCLSSNVNLYSNNFLTFIVGIHDIINRLTESYATDINRKKRKEYINEINKHTEIVYNFVKIVYEKEPLIETDFVKSILINIHSVSTHANIYCQNLDRAKNLIKFFDNLCQQIGLKDGTTSFELVNKVKGDYWFKKEDYDAAISYYNKVVNKMKSNDPKKPVVYFNIGCSFYLKGDKNNSIENLNQCISAFRALEYEKKTFNVLSRQDIISKKVNLAKYLLKNMGHIKN